jgi:hypothetical protein
MTADRSREGPFAALDDYEVRHVVTHLMRAGRDQDVHRLLRLEIGEERRNGWFAERESRGDVGGYLNDVAQARVAASRDSVDAITNSSPAAALSLELRYTLITSSINSLSRNLPPSLLAALAADGTWNITQALRYAAEQPFAPLRAEAFALLAGQCTPEVALECLQQARSAAQDIRRRPDWRVRALGQVAARASPNWRREVVREALDVVREIGSVEADENMATLIAAAPDDMRDEVEAVLATFPVSAAKPARDGIDNFGGRPSPWTYGARRFAELLPGLGQPARLAVIGAFRDGEGEAVYRGIVIGACAGQDPALGDEALNIARSIPEAPLRAEVIAAVSPYLDEEVRARVLGELMAEARDMADPGTGAQVLTAIAPVLPEAGRRAAVDAALSAARAVEDGTLRSYVLRFLTPLLPEERLADVVAEAGRLGGSGDRGRVIAAVAPRAPRSLLPGLLRLCQEIADLGEAIGAVAGLAEAAPEDARPEVVARGLSTVAAASGAGRAYSLEQLIPYLDTGQFTQAWAIAGTIEGADRHRAQVALADHATGDARLGLVERAGDPVVVVHALLARSQAADPPRRAALLEEGWRAAADIGDLDERFGLSVRLLEAGEGGAGGAAGERARDLLGAARESDSTAAGQANAVASLLPFLPGEQQPSLVDDVLARIRQELDELGPRLDEAVSRMRPLQWIPYESTLTWAITGVLPYLTPAQYALMLGIIRDIRQENQRASALIAFAEHAPDAVTVPSEYFAVAGTFTDLVAWTRVHFAALPLLRDGQQRQALIDFLLTQLGRLTSKYDITVPTMTLWDHLFPYLRGTDLLTALDVAATIQDTRGRDDVMGLLVPRLDETKAIAIASTIQDTWVRDHALSLLAPRLDETKAIAVASAIETPRWKIQAFIALAERAGSLRGAPEFVAAVAQLGADTELMPIVALLPEGQRIAVLDAAALDLMRGTSTGYASPELGGHLVNASPARLCSLWRETAPTLAGQDRATVFKRIRALDPFLRRAAGDRVALDITTAIQDVIRWWP